MKRFIRLFAPLMALSVLLTFCACERLPDEYSPDDGDASSVTRPVKPPRDPAGTGAVTADTFGAGDDPASSDRTTDPEPGPESGTETPTVPEEPGTSGSSSVSGQISSDPSVSLRLLCDWVREPGADGQDTLTVTVRLSSYRLYAGDRPGLGRLTVNGEERTFSTPALSIDENGHATLTDFCSASFSVPAGSGADITASWPFNGTYAGREIGTLTAQGLAPAR